MRQGIDSEEGDEPYGDGEQHEQVGQHDHLGNEFLFWARGAMAVKGKNYRRVAARRASGFTTRVDPGRAQPPLHSAWCTHPLAHADSYPVSLRSALNALGTCS